MQAYSDPKRESDAYALPDVEVFYLDAREAREMSAECFDGDDDLYHAGWYWWSCFPGCLPDGDPVGPFSTETEALEDAQSGAEED